MDTATNAIVLAHWRRTVAEMYSAIRRSGTTDQPRAWSAFRATRDELFASHPQTPLSPSQQARFSGLSYFAYDPEWCIVASIDPDVPHEALSVDLSRDGLLRYTRVAYLRFAVRGQPARLSLFWIEGHGGGLFLPFLDATNGIETYGGGRYLYDTIKGADLGTTNTEVMLNFNYAYNPSCAYDDRWACPLSPAENRLPFAVQAGEKAFVG